MTYGSLFSGIGGLDLGLDRAGFTCRWQIEIDDYANRVLEKHWPGVPKHRDITKVTGKELGPVDLICGGFPCQDLSFAGKQAGIEASRSGLWFEYARLIGELRPRYVLIENVPGLLIYDAMRRVVGELSRLGYVGCWRSLRASEFGASHLRKRVFIVACLGDSGSAGQRFNDDYAELPEWVQHQSGESGHDVAHRSSSGGWRGNQSAGAWEETAHRGSDMAYRNGAGCEARNHTAGKGLPERRPAGERELRAQDRERLDDRPELGIGDVDNAAGARSARREDTGAGSAAQREARLRLPEPERGHHHMEFAPGPADPRWAEILRERPDLAPALPSLRGVVARVPDWMDGAMSNRTKRLGRLGNAVVPQIAEYIGRRIIAFDQQQ